MTFEEGLLLIHTARHAKTVCAGARPGSKATQRGPGMGCGASNEAQAPAQMKPGEGVAGPTSEDVPARTRTGGRGDSQLHGSGNTSDGGASTDVLLAEASDLLERLPAEEAAEVLKVLQSGSSAVAHVMQDELARLAQAKPGSQGDSEG